MPKRLRPYFLYDRSLLGDLSPVASRTVTSFVRGTAGEKDLSVAIVSSIQIHGSLPNWHPLLVTDGGLRQSPPRSWERETWPAVPRGMFTGTT